MTFLNRNKLNLTRDKTTVNEMMMSQRRTKIEGDSPSLTVQDKQGWDKIITAEASTRLLGANIGCSLDWSSHLFTGEKALVPRLRKQLGALKLLSKDLPMKCKLLLANGLIVSKICYLIQAWGGTQKTNIKKVQTILNQTARFVTNSNKRTRTTKLMKLCNWLNVHELVSYQSLMTMWMIVYKNTPEQIAEHLAISDERTITTRPARLLIVKNSFRNRTVKIWNRLPQEIRDINKISLFKKRVKNWLIDSRDPG